MSYFAIIIAFFALICQVFFVECCQRLKVEGLSDETDWINGEFILEPTLIADGRPVYIEDVAIPEPKVNENGEIIEEPIHDIRMIYHFSHGEMEELSEEERYNYNYHGRWIIGNDILSSNGWGFVSSWSIDPIIDTVSSLATSDFSHIKDIALDDVSQQDIRSSSKGIEKIYRKPALWRLWLNDEWVIRDDFIITCMDDDNNNNEDNDWLFISTHDHFGINENNSNWLNYQMIHGFYYRLNYNVWKLIEQNIYLYCNIHDNATSISTLINTTDENNHTTYQVTNKLDKECLIYEYYGYTDDNGMPSDGMYSVKNKLNISLELNLSSYQDQNKFPWENKNINHSFIYTNKHHENKELSQKVNIVIINRNYATPGSELEIVKHRKLTIYDAYREYYYRIKSKSIQYKHSGFDTLYKTLNNGLQYHMLGLGTGGLPPDDNKTLEILTDAYQIGYRLIDTSSAYWSETPIGMMISQGKANRDELFIQTKIWPTDLGFLETYEEVVKSMTRMNLNYIDLYMIHWAFCYDTFAWMDCTHATKKPWEQTYHMMEKLYSEGRLLNIGVSNFDFGLMKELEENAQLSLLPQVLQNYFDIAHQDWPLVQIVNEMGIIYQGYATYRGIAEAETRMDNEPVYMQWKELLKEIAASKQNKATDAQLLLRWLLDNNVAVIPRSTNKTHLEENFNLWSFEITDEENEMLLTKANEELKEEL